MLCDEDIANFEVLRDVAMATIFGSINPQILLKLTCKFLNYPDNRQTDKLGMVVS